MLVNRLAVGVLYIWKIKMSVTCEHALLGGLLETPSNIKLIEEWLEPDDFLDPLSRELYSSILDLNASGSPVDVITLSEAVKSKLPSINAFAEVAEFIANNKTKTDTMYYAKYVQDASKKRKLKVMLEHSLKDINDKKTNDVIEFISNGLTSLYKNSQTQEGYELYELMQQLAELKDSEISGVKPPLKLLTGFNVLDKLLGGFKAGHLVTIAANSGVGKSTFGLNILKNVAVNYCTPVLLISLEMSHMEIATSALSSVSGITLDRLNSEENADRDYALRAAIAFRTDLTNRGVRFKIWCSNNSKFGYAVRLIREHIKSEPACKMIMIDYPGLMDAQVTVNKNSTRVLELQYMTRTLKNLAMELNIVILMMAQVNRDNKDDVNVPFKLKDLRDSSSFAHDANIVMFIQPDVIDGQVKINVAKNRGGKTGLAVLGFKKATASFYDVGTGEKNYYDD